MYPYLEVQLIDITKNSIFQKASEKYIMQLAYFKINWLHAGLWRCRLLYYFVIDGHLLTDLHIGSVFFTSFRFLAVFGDDLFCLLAATLSHVLNSLKFNSRLSNESFMLSVCQKTLIQMKMEQWILIYAPGLSLLLTFSSGSSTTSPLPLFPIVPPPPAAAFPLLMQRGLLIGSILPFPFGSDGTAQLCTRTLQILRGDPV